MITVKNFKKEKPKHGWDVRVDRSSPLGNIFFMDGEKQRDYVCDKYDFWFNQMVKHGNVAVCNELQYLIDLYKQHGILNLYCWCAPKRCHAETIKNYIENKARR